MGTPWPAPAVGRSAPRTRTCRATGYDPPMEKPPTAPATDGIGPDPELVRRILVIRPGGLSDVVRAVPALRHLRATYPDAELCVATTTNARELLDACPYVDRTVDLARSRGVASDAVDIAVSFAAPDDGAAPDIDDVPADYRVAWSRADAEQRAPGRPVWPERIDDSARMLRLAWLLGGGQVDHALGLWPTLADRNGAARLMAGIDRPVALLHAGGSRPSRRWPTERWVRVVELVDALGMHPVLVGGSDDRIHSTLVAREASVDVTDVTGCSSVGELAGLLERAALFVGGDSGPAALATALGTRSVVIAPASRHAHAARPGVVDIVDAGWCAACGERSCAHDPGTASDVTLDAVLAVVSLAASRAVERWSAARIE